MSKKLIGKIICFLVIGTFIVTGIGYFVPSLWQKASVIDEQEEFIRHFVSQMPIQDDILIQPVYDAYLEKKANDILIPFLGEDAVRTVIRAKLEIQKKKIIRQAKENNVIMSRKVITDVTNYLVKHVDAFIFLSQTENEERNRFFEAQKSELLKTIQILIGYEPARGDTFQVIDFPKTLSFAPKRYQETRYHQITAIVFISALMIIFIISLPLWIRYFRKKPEFPFMQDLKNSNMYRKQIIGSVDENLVGQVQQLCSRMPEVAVNALRSCLYEHSDFQANSSECSFSPAQQAAIILLCLGDEGVRLMFKQMSDTEIKAFSHIMARLGYVKAIEIHPVLTRFYHQMLRPQDIVAPKEQTKALIRSNLTVERAQTLIDDLDKPLFKKSVWEKLNKVADHQLGTFFTREYPQTSAEILYQLSAEKAARVLSLLPYQLSADILIRLCSLNYESWLKSKIEDFLLNSVDEKTRIKNSKSGEIKAAAILSLTDKVWRKKVLDLILQSSPQTADSLSKRFITLNDFIFWNEKDLRCLLKQIDEKTLTVALENTSDTVKEAFARVIAPQKWIKILKQTTSAPTNHIQEIEEAQLRIIQTAQNLVDTRKCKGKNL